MTPRPQHGARRRPSPSADRAQAEFARVFRSATDARGLSLDRLAYHLSQRGHELSTATLSYWRTGRSVPQRAESLAALHALEDILQVTPGELVNRVPPRRPRGSPPQDVSSVLSQGDQLSVMLGQLGMTWSNGFEFLFHHDEVTLGPTGTVVSHVVRSVVRAVEEGASRLPVWIGNDDPGVILHIEGIRNCRVGRMLETTVRPMVVAELLLPRSCSVGEVMPLEYRYGTAGQSEPETCWQRESMAQLKHSCIEVTFHPTCLPRLVEEFASVNGHEEVSPMPPGQSLYAGVWCGYGPGRWGLRWFWD